MSDCSTMFEIGSVECMDPLVNEDVKPLACRGCLAASRPLQPLERALATLYEQLTGTPVSQSDIYPKFVCSYCRALLLKFAGFRRKCISSQETLLYLHSGGIPITKELLKSGVAGSPYPLLKETLVQLISFNKNKQPTQDYGLLNRINTDESQKMFNNFGESNVSEHFLQFHDKNPPIINDLGICPKVEDDVNQFDSVFDEDVSEMPNCLLEMNSDIYETDSTKPFKDDHTTVSKTCDKSHKTVNETVKAGNSIEYEHCYSKKETCLINDARALTQKLKAKSEKVTNHQYYEETTASAISKETRLINDTRALIEKLKAKRAVHHQNYEETTVSDSSKETWLINETQALIEKLKAKKVINHENYEDSTVISSSNQKDSVDSTMGIDDDLSNSSNDITEMKLSVTDKNSDHYIPTAFVNINMASKKDYSKSPQNINKSKLTRNRGKNIPKNTSHAQSSSLKVIKAKHDRNILQGERISEVDTNFDKLASSGESWPDIQKIKTSKKYNVTIVELTKEEQIKQFMERKNAPRYQNARYKCELCYTGFPFEDRYKIHMTVHEPKEGRKDFICDVCNVRYAPKQPHDKCKHDNNNYVCNECGFVSNNSQKAAVHYRSHKGTKYSCKICKKTFDRPTSVYGHMHLAHGGSVTCSICGEKFIGQRGLLSHIKLSHKEAVGAVCGECGVQFHSHSALRRHRAQAGSCDHTHRPCAECGETFLSDEDLQEHKKKAHQSKRQYACEKCGRQYENRKKYYQHIVRYLGGCSDERKQNRFPISSYKSNSKSSDSKQPQEEFICEVCGVVKYRKITLVTHMGTHTKPFQCDYCQRRFAVKNSLKDHIMTHMTIPRQRKTYKCRHCPTKFTVAGNRWRHEKNVHMKQSLSCQYCGGTYPHKESLQVHINHIHLGKPWPKRTRNRRKDLDS